MDPNFDEGDLDNLLDTKSWEDAHFALDVRPEDELRTQAEYWDLYEVVPLWLYAKECLEEEEERKTIQPELRRKTVVDTLPRSILISIFNILQNDSVDSISIIPPPPPPSSSSSSESNPTNEPTAGRRNPYAWFPDIARVCKSWRNAAYAAPTLWTYIDLSYPKEVVRSLLIMSDSESLHVLCDTSYLDNILGSANEGEHEEEKAEWEIKLELVMDEQSRIETLAFNLTLLQYVKAVPFKSILRSPWPCLTSLSLAASPTIPQGKRTLPCSLLSKNFSRLCELELNGMGLMWDESEVKSLRELRVAGLGEDTASVDGFVSRCNGLGEMRRGAKEELEEK